MSAATVPADCPLTARQFEIALYICNGLSSRDIAARLHIERSTVSTHLTNTYHALGISGYSAKGPLIAEMIRRGWVDWKPEPSAPKSRRRSVRNDRPFVAAYLQELDRWLAAGGRDKRARRGMKIALAGARNQPAANSNPLRRGA